MTNQYKAVSIYGKAVFGEDVFDADFAAAEERDHLDAGHLELVPRTYKVTSNNFTGGDHGSEYEAALPVEIEAALVAGGHLVRKRRDVTPGSDAANADPDDKTGDDETKKTAAKKAAAKK